jgi:hypothetical protein
MKNDEIAVIGYYRKNLVKMIETELCVELYGWQKFLLSLIEKRYKSKKGIV